MNQFRFLVCAVCMSIANSAFASSAVEILSNYWIKSNQTYLLADNVEQKLDVYINNDSSNPRPTLVFIHGGGWMGGSKEQSALKILPYLEAGFNAVNVEYRLGGVALAPAAVEDVRCALRWVYQNAKELGFDTSKLVVSGFSAGGHLSLMTGMLPAAAGLDRRCPTGNAKRMGLGNADADEAEMPVAAIINWAGITDVADLLEGENARTYAVQWMGSMLDREDIAKRVSPLTYVRKSLPPIMTIHGNQDAIVPYEHAVKLHKALDKRNVTNRLYTVEGGGHGGFSTEETQKIFGEIWQFLNAELELP